VRWGMGAVFYVDRAAEDRRPPLRVPDVLVAGVDAPRPRQFDLAAGEQAGGEHAVRNPADADLARVVVERHAGADVGDETGGAFPIREVDAGLVTARQVQLAAHRERPAEPVCGLALVGALRPPA